jgi:hypothetical protein
MLIRLEVGGRTIDGGAAFAEQKGHELIERQLTPHYELEQNRQIDAANDNQVRQILHAAASGKATAAALQIGEYDGGLSISQLAHLLRQGVRPETAVAEWLQHIAARARYVPDRVDHAHRHVTVRDDNAAHA